MPFSRILNRVLRILNTVRNIMLIIKKLKSVLLLLIKLNKLLKHHRSYGKERNKKVIRW